MAKIRYLTDDDVEVLKQVVKDYKDKRVNVPSNHHKDPVIPAGSEVYIAKPLNEDGIPGMETDQYGLIIPGVGECRVYRIVHVDDSEDPELLEIEDSYKQVYNVSPVAISQSSYIQVHKTKGGRWVAVTSDSTVLAKLTNRTTVHGIGYYDFVEVARTSGFPEVNNGVAGSFSEFTAAIELNRSNAAVEVTNFICEIKPLAIPDSFSTGTGEGGAAWYCYFAVPRPPVNPVIV